MSVIAVAVKHLIAAGVTGDALVNAIADMEESTSPQKSATVTPSAIRMRRYREHRKANGMNPSTPEYLSHVDAVKERDFHMCVYCGSDENIVIDHMIPVCQGGTDDPDNLAAACRSCNAGKSGKTPEQWGRNIQSKAAHVALLRYVARNGSNKERVSHTLPKETTTIDNTNTRARPSKGSRLPSDFQPTPELLRSISGLGFSQADLDDQLERFRDWANAATGQVAIKRDWQAAFRNWIKRAADDKTRKPSFSGKPSHGEAMRDAFDGLEAHIQGRGTAARY